MADTAMVVDENIREAELRTKRICRFCLSTEEPLTDLYSQENRLKTRVPLPLQIISCVSIEVFTNDGMPRTVCDSCRLLMDFNYRFKQMCKKSELQLRQYPLTGVWAPKNPLPAYPQELISLRPILTPIKRKAIVKPAQKTTPVKSADEAVEPIDVAQEQSPEPPQKRQAVDVQQYSGSIATQLDENETYRYKATKQLSLLKKLPTDKKTVKPRILNQTAKVLNIGPHSSPDFKTKEDGGIELVFDAAVGDASDSPSAELFPCKECDRNFPLRQLLDMHMAKHNRDRTNKCEFCEKKFFNKYDLTKHMLTHSYVKPFVCSVCQQSFSRLTQLTRHEKSHSDHPQFLCSFCEKSFLNMPHLERHESNHRKNRPFQCGQCDKSFAFKQSLERHEVVHQADQPFKCQYCDIAVSTSSKLTRHLAEEHATGRPFPCRLCPKSYLMSHHLTRHVRSHKNIQSIYICNSCPEQFTSMNYLIQHSRSHSRELLTCPLCKQKFKGLEEVSEHILTHTGEQFACEFCDLIFAMEEQKDDHCDREHVAEQAEYNIDIESRQAKKVVATQEPQTESDEDENIGKEQLEEFQNSIEIPKRGRPRKQATIQPTILNYVKNNKKSEEKEPDAIIHTIDMDESLVDSEANQAHDIENMEFDIIDYETSGDFALKLSPASKVESAKKPQLIASPNQKISSNLRSSNPRKESASPALKTSPLKNVPVAQQKLEKQLQQAMKSPLTAQAKVAVSPIASATPAKPILTKVNMKKLPSGVTVKKIPPEITPATRIATPGNTATPKRALGQYGGRPNANKTPNVANKPLVHRVKMTQAQVDAMTKEGKIHVKNGQVFMRSNK